MATAEMKSIEDIVRTLLERGPINDERNSESQEDTQAEEILFDLEVDGARYLFIRLPKVTQVSVQLTPREREIVRLVAQGHSNKIIADVLTISSWTVCTHVRRIFAKLGVGSRAAMVAHMAEIGRTSASERNGRKTDPPETVVSARRSASPVHTS
jgi:DNA-binding CsgD family transcriptional regulator